MGASHQKRRGLAGRLVIPSRLADWLGARAMSRAPLVVRRAIARQPVHRRALEPWWHEYVTTVSRASMALSLESASFLAAFVEVAGPRRILDAGSGFSTAVLARAAQKQALDVLSVDDDPDWLERTESFVHRSGVGGALRFAPWDPDLPMAEGPFDLVVHDLGDMRRRLQTLASLRASVRPGGWLLLDDAHKLVYRTASAAMLWSARDVLTLSPWTTDSLGRHAALASL